MRPLEDIEAMAAAATRGPWFIMPEYNSVHHGLMDAYVAYGEEGNGAETFDLYESYNVDTDYQFIAHARTDVPEMAAEIRRLNIEIERLKEIEWRMSTLEK